jgi:tight adherence protein C
MGDLDPRILDFAGYIASGALIVIIIASVATVVTRWLAIRARQKSQLIGLRDELEPGFAELDFKVRSRSVELSGRISGWLERLVNSPRYGARLRQRLLKAGMFNPSAAGVFIVSRFGLALGLPLLLALAMQLFLEGGNPVFIFGLPIAFAIIGLVMPDYYITRRARLYQEQCRRGFPDFLDLLVVATDAGMGLEQAISRVGSELISTYPGLGANIYLMTLELRMGRGFSEALNNLVSRTNVPEIRSFATLLQQSRELGSSVTAALRIYSEDMRHKRMSAAEEKAYALPAKMVIPMALFLFPVIVLIVMLPVIVRIIGAFSSL